MYVQAAIAAIYKYLVEKSCYQSEMNRRRYFVNGLVLLPLESLNGTYLKLKQE